MKPVEENKSPHSLDQDTRQKSAREDEKSVAVSELNEQLKNDQLTMDIKVYSPFKDYYEGKAFSVSAVNETGAFDVLPKHHNFITLLSSCDLVIRTTMKGQQIIQISGGIMHVKADKVIVFLDV